MEVMTRELLVMMDLGALLSHPVFYGVHVAPGDGKLVAIIPGFMGNDLYLQPMHNWLRCMGYEPISSTLSPNAGCMQRLREQVQTEIDRHLRCKLRSVALIGHSSGGALAWAIAARMQEQVSHLVMLGAPNPGLQRSVESGKREIRLSGMTRMLRQVNHVSRRALDPDCSFPSCGCAYVNDVELPLSPATSLLSIYGRDDALIPPKARMTEGEVIDVATGHVGLVYCPEVYRALGQFLAHNVQPALDLTAKFNQQSMRIA